jgi:rRNA maturation endonuclease Nob1
MDLKTEIREYFYTIHGSHIETDIANIISITEKHIALQLQQTGVSGCFLEDVTDDVFNMGYKRVSCCKIAPITDENYCPNCGNKILK